MGSDLPHPLEKYVRDSYGFDAERLRRLGVFLLGHTLIDQRLIAAVGAGIAKERGGYAKLTLDGWQEIVKISAKRTFLRHFREATKRGLVPAHVVAIAEEANRCRDHFLHFSPERVARVMYRGVDVTSEEGLRLFLDDLLDFLNAM